MKTLLQVVQEFCRRQGLTVPTAVVTSNDDQIVQILGLLNEGLDELAATFKWPQLEVEATFLSTIAESQGKMEIIAPGFMAMIPNTFWCMSTRLPGNGSISAEDTQRLKVYTQSSSITNFRQVNNELHFVPSVPPGLRYRFEYRTKFLVRNAAGVLQQYFTSDTDQTVLPDNLYLLDLRWRWRMEKGLSYAENMSTLNLVRKQTFVDSKSSQPLSMGGAPRGMQPGIVVPVGNWAGR